MSDQQRSDDALTEPLHQEEPLLPVEGAQRADPGTVGTSPPDRVALPRWVGPLYLLLAAGLVPWIVFLAMTLPRRAEAEHYRIAWVGFDIGMLGVLGAFGFLALRRSRWTQPLATCAATLLIVDAWFDVVTAAGRADLLMAVGLAGVFELPLAMLCVWLAHNVERVRQRRVWRLWHRVTELEAWAHRARRHPRPGG